METNKENVGNLTKLTHALRLRVSLKYTNSVKFLKFLFLSFCNIIILICLTSGEILHQTKNQHLKMGIKMPKCSKGRYGHGYQQVKFKQMGTKKNEGRYAVNCSTECTMFKLGFSNPIA